MSHDSSRSISWSLSRTSNIDWLISKAVYDTWMLTLMVVRPMVVVLWCWWFSLGLPFVLRAIVQRGQHVLDNVNDTVTSFMETKFQDNGILYHQNNVTIMSLNPNHGDLVRGIFYWLSSHMCTSSFTCYQPDGIFTRNLTSTS